MSTTPASENEMLLNKGTPIPDLPVSNIKRYGMIGVMLTLLAVASFSMGRNSGLRAASTTEAVATSMVRMETSQEPIVVLTDDEYNQLSASCGRGLAICVDKYFTQYLVDYDFRDQLSRTRYECRTGERPACSDTFESILKPRIDDYLNGF